MKKIARNTFESGVVMDVNAYDAPSTAATLAHNMRIRRAGKNFIAETESGSMAVGAIKPGYVPLAVESLNGVAYLVSHDPVSLACELGTFPSPPIGGNGPLQPVYKALQNFTPTGDPAQLSDFNSTRFGFGLQHPVTMKLQPSYDGSVNIILTDGNSPAWLVNSGFRVNGRAAVDMVGSGPEAKWYSPARFDSTLLLIQKSERLLSVNFKGVAPGGKLPAGTWRAYFKYATYDDNETEVVAESMAVPVGFGSTVATTRGGKTNEPTDKRILFGLDNLDTSFAYLRVYLAYAAGDLEPVTTIYRVMNAIPLRSSSMELSITGFEQLVPMDAQELSLSFANIETFRTMEQTQNRLFPANVKTKVRDYSVLEKFAKRILLGHREKKLHAFASTGAGSVERLFSENTLDTAETADGFIGGYHNPGNVYHYTGYWGGEASPFGIQFIFDDGSLSPSFPVIGVDNVENDKNFSARSINFKDQVKSLISGKNGWDVEAGLNSRGIYRFPNRNTMHASPLLENGRISVNGVTFQFPEMGDAEFREIRQLTIGCQLTAGERKADVLTQGYLVPVVSALLAEKEGGYDHLDGAYEDERNIKYIPAPLGCVEACMHQNADRDWRAGFFPLYFPEKYRSGASTLVPNNKYAFYAADMLGDESRYSQLLGADMRRQVRVLHTATMRSEAAVKTGYTHGGYTHQFSLAMAQGTLKYTGQPFQGKTSFVTGFNPGRNIGKFSSAVTYFQGREGRNWFRLANSFNSYAGVELESTLDPKPILKVQAPAFDETTAFQQAIGAGSTHQVGYNVNIYNTAQLNGEQLSQRYNTLVGVAFRPITQRMYWDETHPFATSANTLKSKLDGEGKVLAFGGDCFINLPMRRISLNNHDDKSRESEAYKQNLGFTLQLVNEGNTNTAFRSTELFDVNEKFEKGYERSFAPYVATAATALDADLKLNGFRANRLPESKAYNHGFHKTGSDKQYLPFLENVPFVETVFDNRVYHSAQHLNNAFANGYRNILLSAFTDYPKHLGAINRLITLNGALFMITDHAISVLAVNERVTAANDSAGPIFIAPSAVLGPLVGSVTEAFGTRYPFSVVASDNYIYGVDTDNNCIWRTHQGRQLEFISDNFVREHLEKYTDVYSQVSATMKLHDVRSYYHKDEKDIIFVFYFRTEGSGQSDPYANEYTFTLVYNEADNIWQGTRGFMPLMMFSIGDNLYSFDARSGSHQIHRHFVAQKDGLPNYSNFYGVQQESYLEFVVSGDSEGEKLFDTLRLVSNNVVPARLEMANDLGTYQQLINTSRDITRRNTTIEKEQIVVILKKQAYARLRDKYLKIKVVYAGAQKALISSINTVIRNF